MLPERLSLEEAIKNGLHKSILNKLEQKILINEEANFLDLNVPLSEQMRLIKEEKAFKDALGKFSQNKFVQSLKNAGLSEEKYLDMIKTESNFKQLSMPIMKNEYYNKKIINRIINWQNEVRDIEYETFKIVNQNEIKNPSDDVLKSFNEKNKKF
jgi:peptidyl-prolyl cis-trans isomerase D